jgi:hypothetical protein
VIDIGVPMISAANIELIRKTVRSTKLEPIYNSRSQREHSVTRVIVGGEQSAYIGCLRSAWADLDQPTLPATDVIVGEQILPIKGTRRCDPADHAAPRLDASPP